MNGLVLTSGGVKCAFQIGVLKALRELGVRFDIGAGASGGVPVLFGYFNNQLDVLEEVWCNEVSSKRFVHLPRYLKNKPIMDIDYLVYAVMKQKLRFGEHGRLSLNNKVIFPLYNVSKKEREYHVFQSGSKRAALSALYAAIAAPFINDRSKRLGNDLYCDGCFFDPCPWEQVKHHGSERTIVVGTRRLKDFDYPRWFVRMLFRKHKNKLVEYMRTHTLSGFHLHDTKLEELVKSQRPDIEVIVPSNTNRIKNHLLNNSPHAMRSMIRQGYERVMGDAALCIRLTSSYVR